MAGFERIGDPLGPRIVGAAMVATRPKSLSLASAIASASLWNVRMQSTGPKISSRHSGLAVGTSSKMVGSTNQPRAVPLGRPPPLSSFSPSLRASLDVGVHLVVLRARGERPDRVAASSGSPGFSPRAAMDDALEQARRDRCSTIRRDVAEHICPAL